jgi:hypothetical protein
LSSSNLIVEDEWDSMVDGDRHTTVWYWIQSKAMQLEDRGEIDSFKLQTICNAITLSRDKANDLMSCIDRDQPPPYVFVCGILVNVCLWMGSTARGLVWAAWMNDAPGLHIFTDPRLYCDMIILYLATSIFAMLFGKSPYVTKCYVSQFSHTYSFVGTYLSFRCLFIDVQSIWPPAI